jgi:hypothetical protein
MQRLLIGLLLIVACACSGGANDNDTTTDTDVSGDVSVEHLCGDACQEGTTRCEGGEVSDCAVGDDGCRAWSAAVACESGRCADSTRCEEVPVRTRRVRVLDLLGVPVVGAAVLRHDDAGQAQEQVKTDGDGWAEIGWRPGDVVSAPLRAGDGSLFNWVSVFGFEELDELTIGKAPYLHNEIASSNIRVEGLELDERAAVFTGCDATTLSVDKPEDEFRWYDGCVGGDEALVIATTTHSGTPEVVLRAGSATVTLGDDLVLDTWAAPATVGYALPGSLDGFVELAAEVKYAGVGVRRFFAAPGQDSFHAVLVGQWQLQFWGLQGIRELFVNRYLVPALQIDVEEVELVPDLPATVEQRQGLVRLSYPDDPAVDLRATVLVMGNPCEAVGHYQTVLSEAGLTDLTVPALGEPDSALAPTAHSELILRFPALDPAHAILTLGSPSRYPSADLSAIHAAADTDQNTALTASYAMYGQMNCH